MNDQNRDVVSFDLRNDGYGERIGQSGWEYRRNKFEQLQRLEDLWKEHQNRTEASLPDTSELLKGPQQFASATHSGLDGAQESEAATKDDADPNGIVIHQLPDAPPNVDEIFSADQATTGTSGLGEFSAFDPHASKREQLSEDELFNPTRDQYTGLILGFAIANRKYIDADSGEPKEVFMLRPGDDVQITLPTAGAHNAVTENFTVVDFYNSNMHEYDSSFAFMPLERLQKSAT